MLREKSVCSNDISPEMRRYEQLSAQCKQIILAAGIFATQTSLHNELDCVQELYDKDLQQWHTSGHQLGAVCLDMPEPLEAAKHREQQCSSLNYTAAYGFADFGEHLDLVSVRRANYSDEARHLNSPAAIPLRQAEPRGVSFV
jgi:hypothetical protein